MNVYSDPTPTASVDEFKKALLSTRPAMARHDFTILRTHCRAPNHTISSARLAEILGFGPDPDAANLQYGKLAHLIADATLRTLPPTPDGQPHWWRMLAYGNDDSPNPDPNHYEWIMRPELVQALQELKWA